MAIKITIDILPGDTRCDDLSDLAVVFPAYKEEKNVQRAVETALTVGVGRVIVVNDCSPDRTGRIIDQLAEKHENVIALHNSVNLGKQGTVIKGMRKALAFVDVRKVANLDADMQDNPALLPVMAAPVGEYHMTNALRSREKTPIQRRFSNFLANLPYHVLAGIPINDIQSGFRVYAREVAEYFVNHLDDKGRFTIEHTTLLECGRLAAQWGKDFRIAEVRTPYSYVEAESSIRMKDNIMLGKAAIRVSRELKRLQA